MKFKIFIIGLIVLFTSCSNRLGKEQYKENFIEVDTSPVLKIDSAYERKVTSNKVDTISYSFVLSCGSGCALTYDLRMKQHSSNELLELNFRVTMYVDEKIVEEHFESYKIRYSNIKINEIYRTDDNELLLEVESPSLFFEIKKLSETLIGIG